jgi:apolipoprotein D and lipocalin family protein
MARLKRTLAVGGLAVAGLAATAIITACQRHPVGNTNVPQPAKSVELTRYLGRWYEIARYEQSFERGCEAVSALYSLKPDGKIQVLNRCRKPSGEISEARGVARIIDPATNAKLKVAFFRPFYGDYWVLDHAEDYSWSIVGEPSGRYLWILARDPTPDKTTVDGLIGRAQAMGYDTSMLIRTKQP